MAHDWGQEKFNLLIFPYFFNLTNIFPLIFWHFEFADHQGRLARRTVTEFSKNQVERD
jgi:hypothetical protein